MSDSAAAAAKALENAVNAWNIRVDAAFPDLGNTLAHARNDLANLDAFLKGHRTLRAVLVTAPDAENPDAINRVNALLEDLAEFHIELETLRAQIKRTTRVAQHLGTELQTLHGEEAPGLEVVTEEAAAVSGASPEAVALAKAHQSIQSLQEENNRLKAEVTTLAAVAAATDATHLSDDQAIERVMDRLRESDDGTGPPILGEDLFNHIRQQAFDESGKRRPMGRILVNAGVINESQLEAALREQRSAWNRHLGAILVDLGYADEERIGQALAAQTRLPFIYLEKERPEPYAIKVINGKLAQHHTSLPLRVQGRELTVAMANPLDLVALEDLRIASGLEIEPVVASARAIRARLRDYYGTL